MAWTTPKTWNVGDPGTASDLNTYISGNVGFLYGDAGWTTAALLNSWAASGTGPQYMIMGRLVTLRGAATNTSTTNPVFTLPAGYRPSLDMHFTAVQSTSAITIDIAATGNVALLVAGTSLHLDGVTFPNV